MSTKAPATTGKTNTGSSSTSSSNNNKWGEKCITNFSGLTETSSKESIQTFVKWIFFNRKQYPYFITALQNYVTTHSSSNSSLYSILLTVLHEVFLLHSGTTADPKWAMASELRIAFGESLLLPYALHFPRTKLETCIQQWDTCNAFDTPTIIRQIRSKLLASNTTTTTPAQPPLVTQTESTTATVAAEISTAPSTSVDVTTSNTSIDSSTDLIQKDDTDAIIASTDNAKVVPNNVTDTNVIDVDTVATAEVAASKKTVMIEDDERKEASTSVPSRKSKAKPKADDDDEVVVIEKEKDDLDLLMEGKTKRSAIVSTSSTTPTNMTKFDFDAHGIPQIKVHPNEFMEPCRLIATLQIARDLRNDSAVQVSSLLQSLPESVRRFIAEAAESMEDSVATAAASSAYELTDSTAREFVNIMNEQLLDMNMNEQLENVTTFMELIQRQRKARETIHQLLIASRCQFGASDVAETFDSIRQEYTVLKQRAQTLADAMDLEGFEVQPVNPSIAAMAALEKELLPFPWSKHNDNNNILESIGGGNLSSDEITPSKRQKT